VNDTTVSPSRAETPRADVAAPIEVVVLAVGAIVVGLALRFVTRSPLWLDEALSVNIARLPLGDIPEALRHDGHPPLYYFLLHAWMAVFGAGDAAVRALSGLLSVAALPLAWMVGRRRGGSLLAWLTVGVLAMAPFALRYATETRMYSLVILLVLGGYLLIDDITRRGRDGLVRLILLALVSGALLLTHYWSFWLVGAVEVVLAWQWWRGRTPEVRRGTGWAFVAIAAGGLLFLPWVPSFLYQSTHTGTPWASPQQPFSIFAIVLADFGGGGFRASDFVGAVFMVLALLALFGAARGRRHIDLDLVTVRQFRFEASVLVLTLLIGIGLSTLAGSAFASRYASVFFPLFVLLVAGGITRFGDRRLLAGAFAAVLALSCMGAYWSVSFQRSQGRVAAQAINASAEPGDVVVMCPDQLGPAFSRSLRDDVDTVTYPSMAAPDLVDWVDYGERNTASDPAAFAEQVLSRAGNHAVYLVWQTSYKTFEGKCEGVFDAFGAARPGSTTLIEDGGSKYFEPAAVTVFPAPPPANP
jgi:mannosyltransferase